MVVFGLGLERVAFLVCRFSKQTNLFAHRTSCVRFFAKPTDNSASTIPIVSISTSAMAGRKSKRAADAEEQNTKRFREENGAFEWRNVKSLITGDPGLAPSKQVAAYDMDSTLVTTKSGRQFPTNRDDWQLWDSSVPTKLQDLVKQGYKIVIFTNQKGIPKKMSERDFKYKICRLQETLGVSLQVLAGTEDDEFRKPGCGVWRHFVQHLNGGVSPDLEKSFYCGDAAGRPAGWKGGAKKDFSDTDRKFALNVGMPFYTPEEHFLGEASVAFEIRGFDPRVFVADSPEVPKGTRLERPGTPEVVVMVGFPGSGKSSFSKHAFPSYEYISRDLLKKWQKCVQACDQALSAGKSCIIDNTSPDVESRKRYIDVAKKHGVPVRVFWMTTPRVIAEHNNRLRRTDPATAAKYVSSMVFNMYNKNFKEPSTKEGVEAVVKVNFTPRFVSKKHEQTWTQLT
eukprot:m.459687 g.459687  ORF g.459687 m.459687 type:complete len:454 (+) comp20342_c6_seq8:60-1421(+)